MFFTIPNTVRGDNSKTAAPGVVFLYHTSIIKYISKGVGVMTISMLLLHNKFRVARFVVLVRSMSLILPRNVRDMGSSSHWGLIMTPGQEANGDNLVIFSSFWTIMVCWVYSIESPQRGDSNEYTQHTILSYSKKISLNIYFLELWKNFIGTQKRVRISHGKRANGVRATEVRLYLKWCWSYGEDKISITK